MSERISEKRGWIGGWLGGFCSVLVLSVAQLAGGKTRQGVIGLLIIAAACAAILVLAPWKHPETTYRRLMLPIYLLFFGAVGWGVWALGPQGLGIHGWWSLLLLIPIMMPLWLVGARRWRDGDAG
jgi:hypothetical protein